MIRHVVAFRFEESTGEAERQTLLDELDRFPERWTSMKRWCLRENISNRDDRFSHAFTVEFDDEDELLTYLSSEEHEQFVGERWQPLIAERAIVTLRC